MVATVAVRNAAGHVRLFLHWSLARPFSSVAVAALAFALWVTSLRGIELDRMSGLGLVSVLPARFFIAVFLLTVAFVSTLLRRRESEPLVLALVLLLIVTLFALPALIEPVPRFAVTWRHIGVAQTILDAGHVTPRVDAYFNWPGFFILTAAVAKLAGFSSTLPLAAWSPLYFNLAYLLPLLLITRTLTTNRRLIWLSIWVFYLGNWIGQDYFSPQGFSFFLYLVIVAILLRWLVDWPRVEALPGRLFRGVQRAAGDSRDDGSRRWALVACVIVLFVALVPTHQLTPVAVLLSTTALVVSGACRLRWLPPFMAAAITAWWVTGARVFFNGHLHSVLDRAGKLDAVVAQNVTNRFAGDADHRVVVDLTLVAGGAMWILAFLGAWHLLRTSRRYWPAAALAIAPIPLLILQTYGGEMLLRVQLFALPFTAFFAAALLVGEREGPRRPSALRHAAVTVGCLVLTALFLVVRYGNEKFNYFTHDEVAGVERLYALAQPGSVVVAGTGNLPWKYREYEQHRYRLVTSMPNWGVASDPRAGLGPLLEDVRRAMRSTDAPAYLIVERSEKEEADLLGLGSPGSLARFEAAAAASPSFRMIYRNRDASIFSLAAPSARRADEHGALRN